MSQQSTDSCDVSPIRAETILRRDILRGRRTNNQTMFGTPDINRAQSYR